jgi:hypothetical protein
MNNCLNCQEVIDEGRMFCDYLCQYGWKVKQYRQFEKRLKELE